MPATNSVSKQASQRRYYVSNREWKLDGTERRRLKHRYNLTVDQRNDMFREQKYRCACCWVSNIEYLGKWHVDHCHKTGKIRGLVCVKCNLIAGQANDDPTRLMIVVAYLEKHQ